MDEEDWAFHRESLGPWGRASDGWVDLKFVLKFLKNEHDILPDDAARKLKPAITRGDVPSRVLVYAGRWEYVSEDVPSTDPTWPYPVSKTHRVWVVDNSEARRDGPRTQSVQDNDGWFFVDWDYGEARGHTIQVEWRSVLRVLGLNRPGDPEPVLPQIETPARGGRPGMSFWTAFRAEMVRQIYAGESTHRDQLREKMAAWATANAETFNLLEVPSADRQRQELRPLLPPDFPDRAAR